MSPSVARIGLSYLAYRKHPFTSVIEFIFLKVLPQGFVDFLSFCADGDHEDLMDFAHGDGDEEDLATGWCDFLLLLLIVRLFKVK